MTTTMESAYREGWYDAVAAVGSRLLAALADLPGPAPQTQDQEQPAGAWDPGMMWVWGPPADRPAAAPQRPALPRRTPGTTGRAPAPARGPQDGIQRPAQGPRYRSYRSMGRFFGGALSARIATDPATHPQDMA